MLKFTGKNYKCISKKLKISHYDHIDDIMATENNFRFPNKLASSDSNFWEIPTKIRKLCHLTIR